MISKCCESKNLVSFIKKNYMFSFLVISFSKQLLIKYFISICFFK